MTEEYTNRLATETSPYLLQHAHNPVDWYPWGEEAFEKAKTENKPIFLSIGYSTCHWCHVMERESFENKDIAEIMNKYYVNIKVDREENPGVDKLYMSFVTYTSRSGGWPLSVFLTPERYPFFGATYFPPQDQLDRPGFKTLLTRIAQVWMSSPDKVRSSGENIISQLKTFIEAKPAISNALDPIKIAEETYDDFKNSYDAKHGGFGSAPKFPTPVQLLFLMDYAYYNKDSTQYGEQANHALTMATSTLRHIAAGGIHDHVGNGFHRYSTDNHWHVPHFEKMLYDQAQLLTLYTSAYQLTKDDSFLDIVKDIILYVKRDMLQQDGAFYSAEDADSLPSTNATAKKEGAFCVWEASEIESLLDPKDVELYKEHYGILDQGNVDPDQDPHNELQNKNVLYIKTPLVTLAKNHNISLEEAEKRIKSCNEILLQQRQTVRPKPHCDDKVINSWNGLMISGLSRAFSVLHDPDVLNLAIRAADFIYQHMYDPKNKILIRSYRDGRPSSIQGFGDDYSFLIDGLIQLYQASGKDHYLQWATDLQDTQNKLFYDETNSGYFNVAEHDASVLLRMKEEQDGAEPSINAVSASNLIRLSTLLTGKESLYMEMAKKTIESFRLGLSKFPFALPAMVSSFLLLHHGVKELILVTDSTSSTLANKIDDSYVPNKLLVTLNKENRKDTDWLCTQNEIIAQIKNQHISSSSLTPCVYICEHFTCGLPISDVSELEKKMAFRTVENPSSSS
ncbi:spermatogenesis-associated protein 20 [Halteromyces radiatus]|uniref:spermatogenesis-associated protein 20 n=1 Tax=Halteromyces radiatus TaxID=101107 RepID=UPI002220B9A7|nr:spermatogenesis-associated protein 20 [Halteromyces radiatus]KAI8089097.1 spermatogenesis-associated protein 20 [Halteromyces radiatus]